MLEGQTVRAHTDANVAPRLHSLAKHGTITLQTPAIHYAQFIHDFKHEQEKDHECRQGQDGGIQAGLASGQDGG